MAKEETRLLLRETAQEIINNIFDAHDSTRSLFIQLEKEGLITLIEQKSRPFAPKQWFCRFTFERVADFLIALSLLEKIELDPRKAENLINNKNIIQNKGLLEAFSIILPEKVNYELSDVIKNENIDRYNFLLPIIASGFQWRAIETFSEKTKELVIEGLSNSNCCPEILDSLFGIAVIPNHPLNAEFIDELLNQQSLTDRDVFWSALLHKDFDKKGGAWRLIKWSLQADLYSFSEESSRLWVLFLSWCCAASNRRVRDRATKGLTRVFVSHPTIIKTTLIRFLNIDDDYVLERVSLAAYSSILLIDSNDILQDISHTIYAHVFDTDNIPENALIRDWLRLIVELAYSQNLLNDTIDVNKFRPPYNSQPIQIPSEEDIAYLKEKEAFEGNMNLDEFPGGLGGTDFAIYVLESRILDHYYSSKNIQIELENSGIDIESIRTELEDRGIKLESLGVEKEKIHRWFIKRVSELGYPGTNELCYKYDCNLIKKYGGGRRRPAWAERLGKKYYWILLQRLAGILADHLPRKIDSWENETSLPRLQGIDLRDIDPTDLRAFLPQTEVNIEWYKPVNYDFNRVCEWSHNQWVELQDLPKIKQIIQSTDNQGEEWTHLLLNSSLKKVISNQNNAEYPYRNLKTFIITLFVPFSDVESIKRELSSTQFSLRYLDIPNDYRLLIQEYPNTITCQQRFETGYNLKSDLPGTENAEFTTIELLRGNEWEYDCSQDQRVKNIIVPAPGLVNFGNLKWKEKSSWIDEEKVVQISEFYTQDHSGLLIKSDYLKQFLEAYSLAMVCFVIQDKLLITSNSSNNLFHRFKTISIFDGHTNDFIN
ncbi:MAG: hypothetical protein WBA13_20945 [Microcoleaceae cyanobacterium]